MVLVILVMIASINGFKWENSCVSVISPCALHRRVKWRWVMCDMNVIVNRTRFTPNLRKWNGLKPENVVLLTFDMSAKRKQTRKIPIGAYVCVTYSAISTMYGVWQIIINDDDDENITQWYTISKWNCDIVTSAEHRQLTNQ